MSESNTHDGGPAFPVSHYVNADGETFASEPHGMSLRDYFAAKAMQVAYEQYHRDSGRPLDEMFYNNTLDVAQVAYQMADTMLAVRKKAEGR